MELNRLKISELFVSIQGEGASAGQPALFLRLTGCTLACSFCDSIEVWKRGTVYTFDELYDLFTAQNFFLRLGNHKLVLIITGGDPLLQQRELIAFFEFCLAKGEPVGDWIIEVETQGTLLPLPSFAHFIFQWNVSPKLTNSHMPVNKRIVPDVIRFLVKQNSYFKFPVSCREDIPEVEEYVRDFRLTRNERIMLMPICNSRKEHNELGLKVAALCIEKGWRFSPRLQLVLWDKTCGV